MTNPRPPDLATEAPSLDPPQSVSEPVSAAAGAKAASQPVRDGKKKRKKDKVRAAWISFVGRIVAQFVGAAATIVLGLYLVQKYQPAMSRTSDGLATAPVVSREQHVPQTGARSAAEGASLAVLPFENHSADRTLDYLADAMTEELIAAFAGLDGLAVVSRTSVMQYKGQHRMLPDVARELGADLIVEGSIVQADGRVRIVAQLIDGRSDRHLWARSFDRPFRDILAVQTDVSARIAGEVDAVLAPRLRGQVSPRRSDARASSDRSLGDHRPSPLPASAGPEDAVR